MAGSRRRHPLGRTVIHPRTFLLTPLLLATTAMRAAEAMVTPFSAERIDAIERTLGTGGSAERIATLNSLAGAPGPSIGRLLDSPLRDQDPGVQAAAIDAVARSWPTSEEHLAMIRRELGSPSPVVAQAAISAVAAIGDDARLDLLVERLQEKEFPAVATMAHASLVRLHGSDLGTDAEAWRSGLEKQRQIVEPQLERMRSAIAAGDPQEIRLSLHQLLMVSGARSARSELLSQLAGHSDAAIRGLAEEGLANVGGAIATLARGGLLIIDTPEVAKIRPASIAPRALPTELAGGGEWKVVLAALCTFAAAVVWLLYKSPVHQQAAVKHVTRTFRKAMLKGGNLRRIEKAREEVVKTDIFRKGTKAVAGLRKSGLYKAVVVAPAGETVKHATSVFRRKR